MRSPFRWWCLWGVGILVTLSGRPARATDRPLLVVVEAPRALDADAAEIRRAIGDELGAETVAPLRTPSDPPDRALIVAFDRERIAVSLRTPDAAPIARSIPAPPERAARLRAIAWLAGNLARDQVSPLVAEAPPATEPPSPPETPTIATHAEPKPPGAPHWSIGSPTDRRRTHSSAPPSCG